MGRFILVGNGLAGGLLATYLARRGHKIELYERRPDPRAGNTVGGRSINLALSTRGIHALAEVGLADAVLEHAIPMYGRMIHDRDGRLHFSHYDRDPKKHINSIGRGALNSAVTDGALKSSNVRVHFNHRCERIEVETGEAIFSLGDDEPTITARAESIIGVDGAYSKVRESMRTQVPGFVYEEDYLNHAYKELTIPPGTDQRWLLEKNALHIWPRRSFMMIALPNPDGSFTCTLFWERANFEAVRDDAEVQSFFEREFPDAVPLMPELLKDFRENPTGSLVTIKCSPWFFRNRVALVGDAAHAVLPFYGQGMNAAFEDCFYLDRCLEQYPNDRERAFSTYDRIRKGNGDALAELAVQNFFEMRDKTASPLFRSRKRMEHALEGILPGIYLPLYTMVSFTRIPYYQAKTRARRQDVIAAVSLILVGLLAVGLLSWAVSRR